MTEMGPMEVADWIAGIDEVGRGCLAGPVYAAAVVLPRRYRMRGLRDSKKLTATERESLVPRIERYALAWAIGIATVEEIDAMNILQATFLAMRRAVAALPRSPDQCLVDGNQNPRLECPVRMVVGGDDLEPAIMAASVLAKVARDAEMARLAERHPEYGFARHKGYGTPAHLAALQRHGPCALHRRSFAPCAPPLADPQLMLPVGPGSSARQDLPSALEVAPAMAASGTPLEAPAAGA